MKLGGGVPSTPTSLRAGLPPPTDLVRFGRALPLRGSTRSRSGAKTGLGASISQKAWMGAGWPGLDDCRQVGEGLTRDRRVLCVRKLGL